MHLKNLWSVKCCDDVVTHSDFRNHSSSLDPKLRREVKNLPKWQLRERPEEQLALPNSLVLHNKPVHEGHKRAQ